jgi:hypothetical protein
MLAWSSRPATENASSQPPDARAEEPYEPYYEPPKKKVDAIAEAWGIHEPEPFEEFFAGGGNHGDTPTNSIYAGKEGHNSRNKRRDSRDGYRDNDRSANRRSVLPPPQPIFASDPQPAMDMPTGSPPGTRPDGPKRTKSLMHRIRKMRDSPNVPVGDDNVAPSSPTNMEHSTSGQSGNSRPTHRSQPSFLGRFAGGRGGSAQKDNTYPPENSEPFVFIEDSRGQSQNKELPQPPPMNASGSNGSYEGEAVSPGLGRKSSLLRRVRGVVKGTTK